MRYIAWALVALPVLLLAIVGLRYLTRGTPVRRVRTATLHEAAPNVGDPDFVRTVELLSHVRLEPGHHLELLCSGDETYPRLFADLERAERAITIQMYYCKPGQLADRFHAVLSERARAGVRVLFLWDAFGSQSLSAEYRESLEAAGVEVAVFRPVEWYALEKAYNRSHIRVVTIDARIGYTGGFGIDDKWLGDGRHENQWRETNVRFTGPAVQALQATFAAGWAEATGDLLAGAPFFADDVEHIEGGSADRALPAGRRAHQAADGDGQERDGQERDGRERDGHWHDGDGRDGATERERGGAATLVGRGAGGRRGPAIDDHGTGDDDVERIGSVRAGVMHAAPTIGSTAAERFLALVIGGAQRSLFITNAYFVPDDGFTQLLVHAASRGVDVRILTAGPTTDVRSTRLAGRARYEELLGAGVRVWEYAPTMVHAKTIVADACLGAVGTMNFDNRSMVFNDESNLVFHDERVGRALHDVFEEDLAFSHEVTLEAFARRPWTERAQERFFSAMTRIL